MKKTKLKNRVWQIAGAVFLLILISTIIDHQFNIYWLEVIPWLTLSIFCFFQAKEKNRVTVWQLLGKIKSKFKVFWSDKVYRWHLIAITLFILVGLFGLVGFPGTIVYEVNTFCINLLFGEKTISPISGDSVWPAMLGMTLFWPWGFLAALVLVQKLKIQNIILKRISYGLIVIVWGLFLTWFIS